MGEVEMAGPDNTLPMMTGFGQSGAMEMGGVFTVVKVREGIAANDYKDPGWYQHPVGTVAFEHADPTTPAAQPPPAPARRSGPAPGPAGTELRAVRRAAKGGHH